MAKYKCDICGYIHDEEQLGEITPDTSCPVCGVDRSHFVKE